MKISSQTHYEILKVISQTKDGMGFLRDLFPEGKADWMNFCLFSTSGIHGSYTTIEEEQLSENMEKQGSMGVSLRQGITFVVVQPRIVSMKYGIVKPETEEDFEFLKKLRESSREVASRI